MESHEEKLHKLVRQSKINETKDVMKRKASEIDKSKVRFWDRRRLMLFPSMAIPCYEPPSRQMFPFFADREV